MEDKMYNVDTILKDMSLYHDVKEMVEAQQVLNWFVYSRTDHLLHSEYEAIMNALENVVSYNAYKVKLTLEAQKCS
jgi:hypothetical protein